MTTPTKIPKTMDAPPVAGSDASVSSGAAQAEVQKMTDKDPLGTNNIYKGNEVGAPNNIVKVNVDGKEVNAVQTIGTDGTPQLTYGDKTYSLDKSASKAGNQVWTDDTGNTITQTRARTADPMDTPKTADVPAAPAAPTAPTAPVADVPTAQPIKDAPSTGQNPTPIDAQPPAATTPGKPGNEVQPVPTPEQGKVPPPTDGGKTPGGDKTTEPIKIEPVKGGDESSRGRGEHGDKAPERGPERIPERGDGGGSGGGEKSGGGAERGDSRVSIPEKPVEKPSGGESGHEKSPLEKIDLSKPEARRELFEALKSARDILDGKADLKSVDPNKRALVEELMKLDQSRSDKLVNMLSAEFQGKGTGMSDSAYMFNLRTLLGLEKVANPTHPNTPIPGLTPELANSLHNLFKMYSGEGQNPQRSMMLAEAYKFSVDYNTKMGLDKDGLTSRDVLVALNSMSKDFGDLLGKQGLPLGATKDTFAQLVGKQDLKEMANLTPEQAAKMKELAALQSTEHTGAKLPEGTIKPPAQDMTVVGKVEGQLVKDLGVKADLLAQQQASEQVSATIKNQPNPLGQKDPLTAEQKELSEREQGTKKKHEEEREEAARRMAAEAALAAAMGGRATTADITESNEDDDSGKKKDDDDKEARRQYKTKQGDTLEMIAETQLKSKTAATLVYNMNSNRIPTKVMGKLYIISMRPDMELVLPSPNEVKLFKGPYLQFQYREFGSAEDELAFWQKFISGQEPGHSSLFDKFGMGQTPGSTSVAGVDDNFAAEAFTAAQRQNIRTQLGMDGKESKDVSQTAKTVRYGESIRKFAARNLHDEALWELIAHKNNLPIVEGADGQKTVRLKSYQKLVMPTAAEIKEYKQVQSGSTTLPAFEIVSQECPKCRRLVRQNESVCPPPCFYAFVDSTTGEVEGEKDEVKEEQPQGRSIRRRRTTGFIADRQPTPETPSQPIDDEVVNTVLKAAGLSSATASEVPLVKGKLPLTSPSEVAFNPSRRGVKIQDLDPVCRVVLTPKDREGRKFERKLEVLKDGNWVVAVVYEIGAQESFVTEFDPSGTPRKQRIDLPFEPAMELSENHLGEAWKEYRQQFLGE